MGTYTQQQNSILDSIKGRKFGLNPRDFLITKGVADGIQVLTSGSTATAVLNFGVTSLDATTGAASTASSIGTTETGASWTMNAPEPGVEKIVYKVSATGGSTMPVVLELGTGVTAIDTTLGTTFTGVNLQGVGAYVRLKGITATQWLMIGKSTGTSLASSN